MSTAISTNVKVIDYPALSPTSRQAAIIKANLDGEPMTELDLIRVKTPLGGSTTWSIDNNGNLETTEEIVGLLVGIGKRGVLWPSEDPTEQRPVLISNDLTLAHRVSDELGQISPEALEKYRVGDRLYSWTAMSASKEFGFGSARGGSGKRIKESRILAILRDGETWPILVSVGGGSLRSWLQFQKRLPAFHYECVVGLKLTKVKSKGGQPYSMITPRVIGVISEEQGAVANRVYTEALNKMFTAPPAGAVVVEAADSGDEE